MAFLKIEIIGMKIYMLNFQTMVLVGEKPFYIKLANVILTELEEGLQIN